MARIETHYEIDGAGKVVATHVIHTERVAWNQVPTPGNAAVMMDVIDYLKGLRNGTIPIAGTGHELPSNHPAYPGKTRFQVALAEIVRLNDATARGVLGL